MKPSDWKGLLLASLVFVLVALGLILLSSHRYNAGTMANPASVTLQPGQSVMISAATPAPVPTPTPAPTPSPTPTPPLGVSLAPGASIQSAINANPANTRFNLACGTYRFPGLDNQPLNPKDGDSFIGAGTFSSTTIPASPPCVRLNGSRVISSWTAASGLWYSAPLAAADAINSVGGGTCNDGTTACRYPQDLFLDSVVVNRTDTYPPKVGVGGCHWFLDFTNAGGHGANTIYLACDPSGKTAELTVVQQAVSTASANVALQNVTVEKFAAPYQRAALEWRGQGGLINADWITHGHGEGIKPRTGSTGLVASYNRVTENGESGINSGGAVGFEVAYNLIDRNNEDGMGYGSESGATKMAASSGGRVHDNTITLNNGMGLWADENEVGAIWYHNEITNNLIEGIRYELSDAKSAPSKISSNLVTQNGQYNNSQCVAAHVPILNGSDCCTVPQGGTCGSACLTGPNKEFGEIDVNNSGYVTVGGSASEANVVESRCAGLRSLQGGRAPVVGVIQSYNKVIVHSGNSALPVPMGWSSNAAFNMFTAVPANLFDHNSYVFDTAAGATANSFAAQQSPYGATNATTNGNFKAWQASGQDKAGSCTVSGGGAC